ncbi:MAG TPA: hydrogenase expression/formation protein HypE [Bacillota bacterium]|nr:hydrogenase expression/formation protein HypE [Bacillota bacterium]
MKRKILLGHGSGGKLSHDLVNEIFVNAFDNPILNRLDDRAALEVNGLKLAFTTDSFVVNPIFFPGGDIGKIAVCGTVNDLAMGGARPLYLSAGFIIEEGFPLEELQQVVASMRQAADEAGVLIVTGDTKVVEKGGCDKLFINTAGIGLVPEGVNISGANARPGDKVLVSGYMGDHGIAVMAHRHGLGFREQLLSDCAPLNGMVTDMLRASKNIAVLRDPTRGGLATTLNEIAAQSNVAIRINEELVPVRDEVRGACDILGLDPYYVANEGKLVAIVPCESADSVAAAMCKHPLGLQGRIIGEVLAEPKGQVFLHTAIGGQRVLDMLAGEQLPRIC